MASGYYIRQHSPRALNVVSTHVFLEILFFLAFMSQHSSGPLLAPLCLLLLLLPTKNTTPKVPVLNPSPFSALSYPVQLVPGF